MLPIAAFDKLGDSMIVLERVKDDSKEQRSFSDQGSPEESLSFQEEERVPRWSLPLPYFLLFISLAFTSTSSWRSLQVVVIEITPLTWQTSRYISDCESRRLYRVSRGTIFAPFNFDYESPRVTRVSVRDGGLRAAAIVVGNLQHSPPVSSQCAHVQRLKTHEGILSSARSLLPMHTYTFARFP